MRQILSLILTWSLAFSPLAIAGSEGSNEAPLNDTLLANSQDLTGGTTSENFMGLLEKGSLFEILSKHPKTAKAYAHIESMSEEFLRNNTALMAEPLYKQLFIQYSQFLLIRLITTNIELDESVANRGLKLFLKQAPEKLARDINFTLAVIGQQKIRNFDECVALISDMTETFWLQYFLASGLDYKEAKFMHLYNAANDTNVIEGAKKLLHFFQIDREQAPFAVQKAVRDGLMKQLHISQAENQRLTEEIEALQSRGFGTSMILHSLIGSSLFYILGIAISQGIPLYHGTHQEEVKDLVNGVRENVPVVDWMYSGIETTGNLIPLQPRVAPFLDWLTQQSWLINTLHAANNTLNGDLLLFSALAGLSYGITHKISAFIESLPKKRQVREEIDAKAREEGDIKQFMTSTEGLIEFQRDVLTKRLEVVKTKAAFLFMGGECARTLDK